MPNPEKAPPDSPYCVVAGAYITGIVLMRNLARRGVRVCCVDCNPEQPGFVTVYGPAHLCPNPDTDPQGWVEFMVALAKRLNGTSRPTIIASADQFVSAIAAHADALREHYLFFDEAVSAQAALATKQRQYELAGKYGLPVPFSRFIHSSAELEDFIEKARFPCLIKPDHFRQWEKFPKTHPLYAQKVAIAKSAAELREQYRLAAELSGDLLVQEIIVGPDTAKLVYLSVYDRHSRRIGYSVVRQLRTSPIYFGSASVVEPVADEEAADLCNKFLTGVGYAGICEIELKRDSRDGVVRMIEANPRYSVTADAAPYAGVDVGWLHYLDLTGHRPEPVSTTNWNFRHVFLVRDFSTIGSYWREGSLRLSDLLSSYRPPLVFFDFDLRDWKVTARTLNTLFRIIAGPPLKKLLRRGRR